MLTGHRAKEFYRNPMVWVELVALIVVIRYTQYAGQQAGAAITAAQQAKRAADIAACTLQSSNESFNKTLGQMQAQTTAQGKSADAAKTQASNSERALRATIDNFHLEQRAWVGPTEATDPQFTVDGKPEYVRAGEKTILGVYIVNSGKTPAKKMRTRTNMKAMKKSDHFFADYPPAPPNAEIVKGVSVLQPGMRIALRSLPTGVPLTAEHILGFSSGEWILYFYGDIRYQDVFGNSHVTTFCVELGRDLSSLHQCATYNDSN